MQISRLLVENRMMLFLVVICCSTVVHLVYSRYWKRTKLNVVAIVDVLQSNNSQNSIHLLKMTTDVKYSLSNATNISGVSVNSTPVWSHVDLHVEHRVFGHAGEVTANHNSGLTTSHSPAADTGRREPRATIAIGGGITSRAVSNITESNIASQLLFYSVFLPTFCRTASPGFAYRIYLAYDFVDPLFTNGRLLAAFRKTFDDEMQRLCTSNNGSGSDVDVSLHLVECSHAGKPAWAQNDAMMEAYLDHVDYFYRINDDTKMFTSGWTEKFIAKLESYDPPRVGVVGPKHSGGNIDILTYDFVHRTHVDIFGFYYPSVFSDWWADKWITLVYSPGRSSKLAAVRLYHTMTLGKRYTTNWAAYPRLVQQINIDKQTVSRYVITQYFALGWPHVHSSITATPTKHNYSKLESYRDSTRIRYKRIPVSTQSARR